MVSEVPTAHAGEYGCPEGGVTPRGYLPVLCRWVGWVLLAEAPWVASPGGAEALRGRLEGGCRSRSGDGGDARGRGWGGEDKF